MQRSADRPETRLSTRLSFLAAGFGLACWAPLVPFAKQRLGVDDAVLGSLLLCLGLGSVAAMVVTGMVSAKHGSKPAIVAGGIGLAVFLPVLAIANTPLELAIALALFGASLGAIDVAMNIQAVEVDRDAPMPLMSGFHALFSVGGFNGSLVVTAMLSLGASPLVATLPCALAILVTIGMAWPRLLARVPTESGPLFAIPRGIVLLLSILAAITFLVEGAILDWSALLLTTEGRVDAAHGGLGYILFAIAMTVGRLLGDTIVSKVGDQAVLLWGGIVTIAGLASVLLSPSDLLALGGFILVGLGASNIVPVLFRKGGSQTVMPVGLAVSAITTMGYAGILAGPASVVFVAQHLGLPNAFWLLAALIALVPLTAAIVAKR